MADPITFDNHTQPICLPTQDVTTIVEPNSAWATGWGTKNESVVVVSRKLRQVNLPFVNFDTCEREYAPQIYEKFMVCAGRVGEDTCYGDSGGPLVVKNRGGAWFQYGITSFGFGCGRMDRPGIYSRVSTYCNFINATTAGAVTCQNPDTYV